MAKFSGKSQVLEFNGYSSANDFCLTSVEYSDDVDDFVSECAGATVKEHVTGLRNITATVQGYLNKTDQDVLNNFLPGTSADDYSHYPSGIVATNIEIIASSATVLSVSQSYPVSGIATFSFTVAFDDLTIQAYTP